MSFRRFLLISMLVALGLCAIVGVLAVFTSSGENMWRVLGTAIDTAVATGVLLPLSLLLSREKLRVGGYTGMGVVLAAWVCVLVAIWEIGVRTEQPALTALYILFMGIPSAAVLLLKSLRQMRVAVWTFVGGAATAWLLCELSIVLDLSWPLRDCPTESGLVVYGVSTVAAALLVNVNCGDKRYFRWAGIVTATVGLGIAIVDIWDTRGEGGDFLARLAFAAIVPAIVMGHINLLMMARMRAWQRPMVWAVCGFSVLSGLLAEVALLRSDWDEPRNLFSRGSAAAGIVAACGSLALIVVAVLNRKMEAAASTPGALTTTALELTCPRCQRRQAVPFGDSACVQCGLQFSIKVVEPRCPACGYLLYRLTSSRCPECGAEVGAVTPPAADIAHA